MDRERAIELIEDLTYTQPTATAYAIGDNIYSFVGEQRNVSEHRWTVEHMLVFRQAGTNRLYGLIYSQGSTEMQDDIDYFEYHDPELVPVREHRTVVYEPERQ